MSSEGLARRGGFIGGDGDEDVMTIPEFYLNFYFVKDFVEEGAKRKGK